VIKEPSDSRDFLLPCGRADVYFIYSFPSLWETRNIARSTSPGKGRKLNVRLWQHGRSLLKRHCLVRDSVVAKMNAQTNICDCDIRSRRDTPGMWERENILSFSLFICYHIFFNILF